MRASDYLLEHRVSDISLDLKLAIGGQVPVGPVCFGRSVRSSKASGKHSIPEVHGGLRLSKTRVYNFIESVISSSLGRFAGVRSLK